MLLGKKLGTTTGRAGGVRIDVHDVPVDRCCLVNCRGDCWVMDYTYVLVLQGVTGIIFWLDG